MDQPVKKIISIKNLFITTPTQDLLKYFNLELFAGEYNFISSPTGTGKTTLLNYIAGLPLPQGFTVTGDISKATDLQVSYAFQEPRLLTSISVIQNIMLPLQNKLDTEHATAIARIWLQKFNLINKAYDFPNKLSGGEQQRANLARAFAYSQVLSTSKKLPCLLLLDEPFASQDEQNADNIESLIREQLLLPDMACIIISHNKKMTNQN